MDEKDIDAEIAKGRAARLADGSPLGMLPSGELNRVALPKKPPMPVVLAPEGSGDDDDTSDLHDYD